METELVEFFGGHYDGEFLDVGKGDDGKLKKILFMKNKSEPASEGVELRDLRYHLEQVGKGKNVRYIYQYQKPIHLKD
ncbi:TPA: hypothetical protein U5D61_003050 [Yersinia enterocolitica]|nr:hypothetical protein [Yersinia enterocolitica]